MKTWHRISIALVAVAFVLGGCLLMYRIGYGQTPTPSTDGQAGRFQLVTVPGNIPEVLLVDTTTGRVWQRYIDNDAGFWMGELPRKDKKQ